MLVLMMPSGCYLDQPCIDLMLDTSIKTSDDKISCSLIIMKTWQGHLLQLFILKILIECTQIYHIHHSEGPNLSLSWIWSVQDPLNFIEFCTSIMVESGGRCQDTSQLEVSGGEIFDLFGLYEYDSTTMVLPSLCYSANHSKIVLNHCQ